YKAAIVGTDKSHDLAIVQIKAADLQPMTLGDSPNLQVGQKVYALGNPFGPLPNWHGEVIGINTMIASNGVEQSAGIGFAIPINTAKAVVNDLVTLGGGGRPALGVRTIPIDSEIANELGLAADYGLLIVQAVPGGSADRAGLRGGTERAYLGNFPIMVGGDLIVAVEGEKVESQQVLDHVM